MTQVAPRDLEELFWLEAGQEVGDNILVCELGILVFCPELLKGINASTK